MLMHALHWVLTGLARRLGVFDTFPDTTLLPGPPTARFDGDLTRLARIIEQDDPIRWTPVGEVAAAGARRVRPAPIIPRDRPRLPPRAARVTLDDIWERFDAMEAARQRSDRALRLLMTHQGCQVPDWFAEPDEEPQEELEPEGEAQQDVEE